MTRHLPKKQRYIMINQPLFTLNLSEFKEMARLSPGIMQSFHELRMVVVANTMGLAAWRAVSRTKPIPEPNITDALLPPDVAKKAVAIINAAKKREGAHFSRQTDPQLAHYASSASTGDEASCDVASDSGDDAQRDLAQRVSQLGTGAARRRRSVMTRTAASGHGSRRSSELSRVGAARVWGAADSHRRDPKDSRNRSSAGRRGSMPGMRGLVGGSTQRLGDAEATGFNSGKQGDSDDDDDGDGDDGDGDDDTRKGKRRGTTALGTGRARRKGRRKTYLDRMRRTRRRKVEVAGNAPGGPQPRTRRTSMVDMRLGVADDALPHKHPCTGEVPDTKLVDGMRAYWPTEFHPA